MGLANPASARTYRNCTELTKLFAYGVARDASSAAGTQAVVNRRVYFSNSGLDRDKDGVACER